MTEAVASWKAYVSVTAAGQGAYGKECERLSACGMTEMVETHFVEATEVRSLLTQTHTKMTTTTITSLFLFIFKSTRATTTTTTTKALHPI